MLDVAAIVTPEQLQSLWLSLQTMDPSIALVSACGLLFLAGAGLPVPEDIPLTFMGIMLGVPSIRQGLGGSMPALLTVFGAAYVSILLGDLVAYWLGRRFGRELAQHRLFRWLITPKRVARLERWFQKFGNWTVFLGRMVAGIRFVTFVSAGAAKMPLSRFILFDSLAALVTVPAWIGLGYFLGTHFDSIVKWIGRVNATVWIAVGVAGVAVIVAMVIRRRRRRARELKKAVERAADRA